MAVIISILVMGIIGGLFGLVLAVLDKTLRVKEDPIVEQVVELLPGLNCGACGQAGCTAFAKNVAKNKDLGTGCLPLDEEINEQIADIIGAAHIGMPKLKLITKCSATCQQQKRSFEYRGPESCAVVDVSGGNIDCKYGCLALGDCVRVCPVEALTIEEGTVVIDNETCIDCGACVRTCPRALLEFADVGDSKEYYVVGCSNPEDALSTKKVCSVGCIGCGICIKLVKESPYYLENKISRLDYKKAQGREDIQIAMDKCPVKIIKKFTI